MTNYPVYIGIIINQYKDLYLTTRIELESKERPVFLTRGEKLEPKKPPKKAT